MSLKGSASSNKYFGGHRDGKVTFSEKHFQGATETKTVFGTAESGEFGFVSQFILGAAVIGEFHFVRHIIYFGGGGY